MIMGNPVPRTCVEFNQQSASANENSESFSFENYRAIDAYVLLAGPGAGKTTTFTEEAKLTEDGCYVTARNFLTFQSNSVWSCKTLFIDGLDEIRAGAADNRTSFDKIRSKLDELGKPRFRLSCRNADWFGAYDRDYLKKVSPTGEVSVLLLNSLSDNDVNKILEAHPKVENPQQFVDLAHKTGISGILRNPQSLNFLAEAVASENWPNSRQEIFDRSCRSLLTEHNQEHRMSNSIHHDASSQLDLAGRLYAILLLSGYAGYSLTFNGPSDTEYLSLNEIYDEDWDKCRLILNSKLFEPVSEDRFDPIHRQVGEFLAAKFAATRIASGLPSERVLALISGYDGGIVSPLRGFSAWLAAHSKSARSKIIERDPIGTVLYGDIRNFSSEEKLQILAGSREFAQMNPMFSDSDVEHRLGELITPETVDSIRESLESTEQASKADLFHHFQLRLLRFGQIPEIAKTLINIVRNDRIQYGIRILALETIINYRKKNNCSSIEELRTLLEEVVTGKVSDSEDDILGILLTHFYPEHLSPSEILKFLKPRKKLHYFGPYYLFWGIHFCENSTLNQLTVVLDRLVAQPDILPGNANDELTRTDRLRTLFPLVLLKNILEKTDGNLQSSRLFGWLGFASGAGDQTHNAGVGVMERDVIRCWLKQHPEIQKLMIALGVEHCLESCESSDSTEFRKCMNSELHHRLFGAKLQLEHGLWYLNQATIANNPFAMEYHIRKTAEYVYYGRNNKGLPRKLVTKQLVENTSLLNAFNKRLAELKNINSSKDKPEPEQSSQLTELQRILREYLESHQTEILENRGRPEILYHLASAYCGRYSEFQEDDTHARIGAILGNDCDLIELVLEGFRKTVQRDDVPDIREILRLRSQRKTHYLMLPFIAGLEEIVRTGQSVESILDEKHTRTALAILFIELPLPMYYGNPKRMPNWYKPFLDSQPQVVAEVLVQCNLFELRNSGNYKFMLYDLAFDQQYKKVAKFVSLPLLKAFPLRCKTEQLRDLGFLLKAASLHCEKGLLQDMVEKKLAFNSMTVAQRSYWLTAGLIVSPDSFLEQMNSYLSGSERRIRSLAKAVSLWLVDLESSKQLSISVLNLLVRSIGFTFRPRFSMTDSEQGGDQTQALDAAEHVRSLIYQLSRIPTDDASTVLQNLSSDDNFLPWRPYIDDAKVRQIALRREVSFRFGSAEKIQKVFDNLAPANASDLAVLAYEHIVELSKEIRNNNTSDWRQYWNVDSYNRPNKPKPENACRDAFLSDLKSKLQPLNIHAQPQGIHTNDNCSDIQISYDGLSIPVEIKHNGSDDLWIGIREQLIKKYTGNPRSDGHGIYLVFWFGIKNQHRTPSGIESPQSATELEELLRQRLSEQEEHKILICVVDVSKQD